MILSPMEVPHFVSLILVLGIALGSVRLFTTLLRGRLVKSPAAPIVEYFATTVFSTLVTGVIALLIRL
ncbi:MAG: hypothetical protein EXR62_17270 [Chloroflexi bacterium]|nr:hypothetical protein [Chloroflexota bacterium]